MRSEGDLLEVRLGRERIASQAFKALDSWGLRNAVCVEEAVVGSIHKSVYRFVLDLYGREVLSGDDYDPPIDIPASWRDAMLDAFLRWIPVFRGGADKLRRRLVRYRRIFTRHTIKHFHVCPHFDKPPVGKEHLSFVMWGTPAEGSAFEYRAYVEVAKQAMGKGISPLEAEMLFERVRNGGHNA